MHVDLLHPRDQIALIMARIYGYGMTTTSGGNLSVRDDDGTVWITPAGVDKGRLTAADIVAVLPDGTTRGPHAASSELPFHLAIYRARAEVRAIVHAHPPALVAFSIMGETPDTRVLPKASHICGRVGFAPYAVPGSAALGEQIATTFAAGHLSVLLENHGVVVGGSGLFDAFQRFETLDFCARLILHARRLGGERILAAEQLAQFDVLRPQFPEFTLTTHSNRELELRQELCGLVRRAYDQQVITSTEGAVSARVGADEFLITPYGIDRKYVEEADLLLIRDGQREAGRAPSKSAALHRRIYADLPEVNAIIVAHPPHVLAFGISGTPFNTRTIPESYLVLRDIPVLPYGPQFDDPGRIAGRLGAATPVVMVQNDCLITTGKDLLQAFDRLEVAEYSAKALVTATGVGTLRPISDTQVRELRQAFGLPPT